MFEHVVVGLLCAYSQHAQLAGRFISRNLFPSSWLFIGRWDSSKLSIGLEHQALCLEIVDLTNIDGVTVLLLLLANKQKLSRILIAF